jgi:amidase
MNREDMHITCANPATGPLYIDEAAPGDILKVEILEIIPDSRACMRVRPGSGAYEIARSVCRVFQVDPQAMTVDFEGIVLPLRPMIGVIGTAPAGEPVDTETPGEHGGNLDIQEMCAGTALYLPVNVAGALLSMGDIHGLQGDGESANCGLEMNGIVTVRVTVLKNRTDIPTPFLVTPSHYITTAAHPSLDECSVAAARKMHRFLMAHTALDNPHAAMLLSLKGDLRISQIVNPAKGCMMAFPKGIMDMDFE